MFFFLLGPGLPEKRRKGNYFEGQDTTDLMTRTLIAGKITFNAAPNSLNSIPGSDDDPQYSTETNSPHHTLSQSHPPLFTFPTSVLLVEVIHISNEEDEAYIFESIATKGTPSFPVLVRRRRNQTTPCRRRHTNIQHSKKEAVYF